MLGTPAADGMRAAAQGSCALGSLVVASVQFARCGLRACVFQLLRKYTCACL